MSSLVERIVGQLEFEKGDCLLHPVTAWCGRVRVHVGPAGRLRLGLPRHFPLLVTPLQGKQKRSVHGVNQTNGGGASVNRIFM